MIHKSSDVASKNIGENTQIWQFTVVLQNAVIGMNCNINSHCFIEDNVCIGNNVTLKSGVYIWDGIIIEDNVFIGPNVTFINDSFPRSKQKRLDMKPTIIKKGASVGANSTIMAGVEIGMFSLIGAGSLVTKDTKNYSLNYGSPSKQKGWVNSKGEKLILRDKYLVDSGNQMFEEKNSELILIDNK